MSKSCKLVSLLILLIVAGLMIDSHNLRAESRSGDINTIDISRKSAVEISSKARNSKGSGFIIADQYVATAFHVVASIAISQQTVNWSLHPDLQVKLPDGEVVGATCITIPTQSESSPLQYDFALLRLEKKPRGLHTKVEVAEQNEKLAVGDDIIFSGYPLATPGMVTHKGMISGFNNSGDIIILQAAINKGNSGGAVLTTKGKVIGIISMREGGISKGLAELNERIEQTKSSGGGVKLMGVDPLQSTQAIIQTLDQFISEASPASCLVIHI